MGTSTLLLQGIEQLRVLVLLALVLLAWPIFVMLKSTEHQPIDSLRLTTSLVV